MEVLRTTAEFRAWRARVVAGRRLGLVPTLGALHDGHLSHGRRAVAAGDVVAVSIFLNPLQFGASEDLAAYPRDLERDLALLRPEGVAAVLAPDPDVFTPPDLLTTVSVRRLTDRLEGASRPGHFDGVTTIVTKLLNVVQPDRAYFGEKDYQQLTVIRRLVDDLELPVEIVAGPTVRDADGLALSSRNAYLSSADRRQALALSAALFAAADHYDGDADAARRLLRSRLGAAPGVRLDYAEVVDPETLEPLEGVVASPAQALVAAFVGSTRLIDNLRLDPRLDVQES